jgi:hypothetical protein
MNYQSLWAIVPELCLEPGSDHNSRGIPACEVLYSDRNYQEIAVTVASRHWAPSGPAEMICEFTTPSSHIPPNAAVIAFLYEAGSFSTLPFTWYQNKIPLRFSCEFFSGTFRIKLKGNFINNITVSYSFRLIALSAEGFKKLGAVTPPDYYAIKRMLID